MKKFSSLKNLFIIFATSGLTIFGTSNRPLYSIPEPITVAVTKVLDRSNAPWFKKSFEDGQTEGLNLIEGSVKEMKIDKNVWTNFVILFVVGKVMHLFPASCLGIWK